MPVWHRIKTLWRNLAHKQRLEADLDEEIRSCQAMLEDEQTRAGASPGTARREALMELGGAGQLKEQVRDVRLGSGLDSLGAELRQAVRGLRRNPGLTATATIMLALGMGATTLLFSIFYSALLKPLPFRDSSRLMDLEETRLSRGVDEAYFSEANFWDLRARQHSFEEMGVYHSDDANLTGNGMPEKVSFIAVSAGFFRTLGVSPALGRVFTYDEEQPGQNHVVILGNRFWRSRMAADPKILGKTLRLSDQAYTVVGVLPPGEPWLDEQTYVPFGFRTDADRGSWEYNVVGRLKPGVSPAAARADLAQVAADLAQAYPADDKGIGFRLDPASTWVAGDKTRRALWVLLGAVTFLLLIACLNIANLLLARGISRRREIAVRTALGAGRARLVRFVMMESLLLSGFGAALGIGLAYGALRAVQSLELPGIPRLADASLNLWVLAFAALIAGMTGVLSGLAPALQAPVNGIAARLRESDRQAGIRGQARLRAALVTGEVALSFFLLVGAGLLIRSFSQMMGVDSGFHTENRLVFSVSMPGAYFQKGVGKQFLDEFFARLAALPQVIAAGAVNQRPVQGANVGMGIGATSQTQDSGHVPWAGWRIVTPGYFRTMGLPLVRGRLLNLEDQSVWGAKGEPEPVRHVVISQRLAKLLFPNQDAVGKHVVLWKGQNGPDAEVVGVVGDMRERGLTSNPTLTVYLPYGKKGVPSEFVVQTRGNPMAVMPAIRSIIAGLDPDLPISDVRSLEDVVTRSVAPQRFDTILLGVFGGLALLLAMTGIYGVLSYSMSRRTSEIGLRVALGANGRSILRMTIAQGMRPVMAGLALGAAGAVWLSRYFAALLFGVKPFDALTYAAVAVLLLGTALMACYLPGRRAARIDPAVALRIE